MGAVVGTIAAVVGLDYVADMLMSEETPPEVEKALDANTADDKNAPEAGKNGETVGDPTKSGEGLTTPSEYFGSKSKEEVTDALEGKFGPAKSSRKHADTYYDRRSKRSYNVHEEPGHNSGKPHVDVRRRGPYEERKYDLKQDKNDLEQDKNGLEGDKDDPSEE